MKNKILILSLLLFLYNTIYSQVTSNSPLIVINSKLKSTDLVVSNKSEFEKEVEIGFKFAYTIADSTGKRKNNFNDSVNEQLYSLNSYIKAFPKKFVMQPNSEQTVKLIIKDDKSFKEGTYFTKISIKSKDLKSQLDTNNISSQEIRTGIIFIIEMLSTLYYCKGTLNTGVDVQMIKTNFDSSNLRVFYDISKIGNSPAIGKVIMNIYDESNKIVANDSELVGFYFDDKPAMYFDKTKFHKGKYKAEIIINQDRNDIPAEYKVPFIPIKKEFEFTIDEIK